jgi:hypothetical protein
MAEHGGAGRGGSGLEFRGVPRLEDAWRALLTAQELEEERAREMGMLAHVPRILLYDNGPAPIHWHLMRQEEGGNLPALEELEEGDEPPPLEEGPPEDLRGGSRAGA